MEEQSRLEMDNCDSFGMIPFGSEKTPSKINVIADTHNFSVRYHPSKNLDSNGILTEQPEEFTSADLEIVETRRKASFENGDNAKPTETKKFSTIDEAIDYLGFGAFQIKIILLTGFAVTADAAEMLTLSVLAPAVACQWGLSSTDQAVLTMSVFGGMLVGASSWGKLSDKFGRRNSIVLFTIIAAYCEAMCAAAPRFEWVVLFNVLVGFSVGGTPQTGTLLSEFLPSRWRAASLIGLQLFWALGGCFEAFLALLVMEPLGWRALMLFNTLPLLLFLSTAAWLPESVRFLLLSGRLNEAQATLDRLARANRKPRIDLLNIENLQCQTQVNRPRSGTDSSSASDSELPSKPAVTNHVQRGRLRDLFGRAYRRVTLNLWPVWFLSAFSYYGIVLLTATILQLNNACHGGTGETRPVVHDSSPTSTCRLTCVLLSKSDYERIVWTTVAEFPAIIVVLFIVDKWGRRNTLAVNYGAFALVMLLLNICMDRTWTTVILFAARAFVTGAHQTLHVYTPESYPTALRATGVGSAASCGRVGAMLTPLVAQLLAGANQLNATFAIYAISGVLAAGASLYLPFETSGRQLAEHVNHVASIDESSRSASVSDAESKSTPSSSVLVSATEALTKRDEDEEAFEQALYAVNATDQAIDHRIAPSLQRRNAPNGSREVPMVQQIVSLS